MSRQTPFAQSLTNAVSEIISEPFSLSQNHKVVRILCMEIGLEFGDLSFVDHPQLAIHVRVTVDYSLMSILANPKSMRPSHRHHFQNWEDHGTRLHLLAFADCHPHISRQDARQCKQLSKTCRKGNVVEGIGNVHTAYLHRRPIIHFQSSKSAACSQSHLLRLLKVQIGQPGINHKPLPPTLLGDGKGSYSFHIAAVVFHHSGTFKPLAKLRIHPPTVFQDRVHVWRRQSGSLHPFSHHPISRPFVEKPMDKTLRLLLQDGLQRGRF